MANPVFIQHTFKDPLNKLPEICAIFEVPPIAKLKEILKSEHTLIDGKMPISFIYYEWNSLLKLYDVLKQLKSHTDSFFSEGQFINHFFAEVDKLYQMVIEANSSKPVQIEDEEIARNTFYFNGMVKEIHENGSAIYLKIDSYYRNKIYSLIDIVKAKSENQILPSEIRKKTSLIKFMEECCLTKKMRNLKSKTTYLHKLNREKRIKLPPLACTHKKGQSKYYFLDELVESWSEYCLKMPTLPPLDPKKVQKVKL